MHTGFDTIGNATVIAYDKDKPIVVTDPWIAGGAYFGSWSLSHEIPKAQMEAIHACPYVWFSHGHPDHLNPDSIDFFKGKTILLPDHVGARIKNDLEKQGFTTSVLPDRKWVTLSEKVKIFCIADYYQDAILLIDINGRLLIDTNDAIDRGWGRIVRKIASAYKTSVLLSLFGYGDADMINFYDENGKFMEPKAARRLPVGISIQEATSSYGVSHVIPFSSMHHYQRSDSIWANKYTTGLDDYAKGFNSKTCKLLPAFIRFDCETDKYSEIKPAENKSEVFAPEKFGDNWSDALGADDIKKLQEYFGGIEHLHKFLDFINFRVGGKDYTLPFASGPSGQAKFKRGLTFEAPRHSLMVSAEYQIFDDMLIGNFMKTKLHGKWPESKLYPDFIPYVARYADNAYIRKEQDLEAYFAEYQKRAPIELFFHRLEQRSIDIFRARVTGGSPTFQAAKKLYWFVKGLQK